MEHFYNKEMMRGTKNKITGFAIAASLLIFAEAKAQDYIPAWKVSAGMGYMNYFGDVSPYTIKHWEDWDRVFKFFQYNKHYIPSASLGVAVERYLTPGITLMLQANQGSISMSDRYRKPDGDYDRKALHWDRALNFETKIQDAGLDLVFRSNNGRLFPVRSILAPYFFFGGGITHFKVEGDLYDEDGQRYDYADPDLKPDGIYETSLRPLMTETSTEYPDIVPYVNAGLGLSVNIGKRLGLSIQTDIKYAFSDYLDDVSGKYKEKYPTAEAAYAAHPGTNIAGPANPNRGNNEGVNDFYIFNKLSLSINLGNKSKAYFHAPAIYLPTRLVNKDSLPVVPAPGISSGSAEMPAGVKEDSGAIRIMQELDQIKFELLSLRFAHIDQYYIIRRNEALSKLNILQKEKEALDGKPNKSDGDRLQITRDHYLIDSLHHALEAIHDARLQLRSDMAYSPIVTEYKDSTKIMIYRGRELRQDSGYFPVAGRGPLPARIQHTGEDTVRIYPADRQVRNLTGADHIRRELFLLQQEAASRKDTALAEHTRWLQERLDSVTVLKSNLNADSLFNAYYIRQDSLRITALERQADSLRRKNNFRRQKNTRKDNFFRHFFDQFKRRKSAPADTAYQQTGDLYRTDSLEPRTVTELDTTNNRLTYSQETGRNRYTRPYSQYRQMPVYDRSTARLLRQNQEEIDRLQDRISRFRTYNPPAYSAPPTVIFRGDQDGRLARQERRDRRRTREFNRDMIAAMAGSNHPLPPATVSPNIILPPEYGNNDHAEELDSLRHELDVLKQQYDSTSAGNDRWTQAIPNDTSSAGKQNALVETLLSKIDSLSDQLSRWKERDSSSAGVNGKGSNPVLLHYPSVSTYFAIGSAVLSPAEKQKIQSIATVAQNHPQTKLLITGFTDGTGRKSINEQVSRKRCDAVKRVLTEEYGISAGRLDTRANISDQRGSRNPLMRRVDIQFVH